MFRQKRRQTCQHEFQSRITTNMCVGETLKNHRINKPTLNNKNITQIEIFIAQWLQSNNILIQHMFRCVTEQMRTSRVFFSQLRRVNVVGTWPEHMCGARTYASCSSCYSENFVKKNHQFLLIFYETTN